MDVCCQGNQFVISPLELLILPPTSREGRGAGDWIQSPMASDLINSACVMKPPIKPQKDRVQRAPGWWRLGNEGRMGGLGEGMTLLALPLTWPCASLPSSCSEVLSFYNKLKRKVKVTQSCLTLCDLMDYPWNSLVFARILEWVAFPFSREIFPTQGSKPGLPHCRRILYQLSHKESPRILEWGAYCFSSRSSQPRNRTRVSCIAGSFFTNWAMREANSSELKPVEILCVARVTHSTLLRRRKRSLVTQQ